VPKPMLSTLRKRESRRFPVSSVKPQSSSFQQFRKSCSAVSCSKVGGNLATHFFQLVTVHEHFCISFLHARPRGLASGLPNTSGERFEHIPALTNVMLKLKGEASDPAKVLDIKLCKVAMVRWRHPCQHSRKQLWSQVFWTRDDPGI